VVLGLSAPAKPKILRNSGKSAVLEISGVGIASDLERTLDTSAFSGPVRAVSSFRDPKNPDKVRVIVDLDRPAAGELKKVGNTYYWDFDKPSKVSRRTAPRARTPRARTTHQNSRLASFGAGSSSITQQTVAQMRSRRRRVYRGRKIDLNFKDADIHNLLRILATVGGVNIVVPQTVRGTVTVRLKSVPWDQAMEVILASQGMWYRRSGSLIRVDKRETLDKEDKEAAEAAAARVKAEPPEPEIFTLNYADANQLKGQLGPLLSPKGRIEIDPRTNALIVNDVAAHRRRIIDLANRLDTQTPQIQIEARVVEARTTFAREFGIQWGGNVAATPQGGNATGLIFPNSVQVAGAAEDGQTPNAGVAAVPSDFAVNLPAAIGTGSGGGLGISLGSVGGNFNINLRLSALEDTGTVRIISSPKITTSNNIQARIKSGVSIPVSVVSANGTQTQFVPADLSLEVQPSVSQRDCSVSMKLIIKKNEADFANTGARGDPSIITKEAETTILVADGETAVVGGIYTRNTGLNYSKVPFFAEIPVIGYFFKNRSENDERAETLVFITPKITNRAFLRCQ
jgi:type IV pilus assembly protein PilQ